MARNGNGAEAPALEAPIQPLRLLLGFSSFKRLLPPAPRQFIGDRAAQQGT